MLSRAFRRLYTNDLTRITSPELFAGSRFLLLMARGRAWSAADEAGNQSMHYCAANSKFTLRVEEIHHADLPLLTAGMQGRQ
jgi:hypothetical protein